MCKGSTYGPPPWLWAMMGRGSRMHGKHGHSTRSRAREWMWENPAPDEIIEMLEEYQRDLEQEVANIASRIKEMKEARSASDA